VAGLDAAVTRELRLCREELVRSREEERRRLRHDLHDGVGPTLAGISLGLEGAAQRAGALAEDLGDLLDSLRREATGCVAEVRRIVSDLRPAVLDEAGLVPALHRHAELITARAGGDLRIDLEAGPLPALPAAVEAAAYRIALEALTNVVRHSRAAYCRLDVRMDGALRLSVTDDGVGLPPGGRAGGVGLTSMRNRAEELGGSCTVTAGPDRGTVVTAVLPVAP
jgi:signal transduction histidine kinase